MKKILYVSILFISVLFLSGCGNEVTSDSNETLEKDNTVTIYFFMSEFCLQCREISLILDELLLVHEFIEVVEYDILINDNEILFLNVSEYFQCENNIIPYVIVGEYDFKGSYEIENELEEILISYRRSKDYIDVIEDLI